MEPIAKRTRQRIAASAEEAEAATPKARVLVNSGGSSTLAHTLACLGAGHGLIIRSVCKAWRAAYTVACGSEADALQTVCDNAMCTDSMRQLRFLRAFSEQYTETEAVLQHICSKQRHAAVR